MPTPQPLPLPHRPTFMAGREAPGHPGLRSRRPGAGSAHRRPGHHHRSQCHHRAGTGLAGRASTVTATWSSNAAQPRPVGSSAPRRPGHAGGVQQPVHGHCRAHGRGAAETAWSANIKERLDFSCALFDQGHLVANAPHVPVHLGSMGESVRAVIEEQAERHAPRRCLSAQQPLLAAAPTCPT
jgi:hypothetical protein